jgi:ankyrin repeat protein
MRALKITSFFFALCFPLFSMSGECDKIIVHFPSLETLIEACKCGHIDVVKQHIDAGVKLNDHDTQYWTPLMTAIANRNYEIADLLIAHGADVNMRADYEETVLFMAVRTGSIKGIKYLISKGANVNARNRDGETPLFALKYVDVIAKLLIDAEADINARDKTGTSVLSHFVKRGDNDVIKLLVKHGAKE